ncbi:FkbM family methyltransferase [Stella humosa]|uniref:FkbM family methyltransferase n=1 Tax=Stella humosa TaxID=94 RepID=A0A3N1ME73_9PROT|nr:FkbM family methyltransferase [Stella humosa]ROQ01040.1 FkbM family methyltransferase [Stella humosa]
MRMGHLVQADLELADGSRRFWMDSCGGRDQVAMSLLHGGWAAYEAPLPALVAAWCQGLHPTFLDVGANTGFYSLLAAAAGARQVHAFEPVAEILDILRANLASSEAGGQVLVHPLALGDQDGAVPLYLPPSGHGLVETSASINRTFRATHSDVREVRLARLDAVLPPAGWDGGPVVLKLDVETHEPAVLAGARGWLDRARPAIVCEILPGTDPAALPTLLADSGYRHFALAPDGDPRRPVLTATPAIHANPHQRDHVFLPAEAAESWLTQPGIASRPA